MTHIDDMKTIYDNTLMENLLSKVDKDLEKKILNNNEFEDDFNYLIGNFQNYEFFIYKYSLYPCYKLILETNKYFSHFRNCLNDGNSYYRIFMFSLLESYITNKNINEFEILISEILSPKFCDLYRNEEIDDILIKDIFSIIHNYLKNDKIKNAYDLLIKVYKLKNQMFDKAMIIYLKTLVFNFISIILEILKKEPKEKYTILKGLLCNPDTIKEYGIDPSFVIICLMQYLFNINMKLFYIDGLIYKFKNGLIDFEFENDDDYPIINIGYFFSGYTILYNDKNINNIIKEEIEKSNFKLMKLTYILDDKEKCKMCDNETNHILFIKKKFICCENCLNQYIKEIINKRKNYFEEDSFNGLEYYSRRIHLEDNLYLDDDECIELYEDNILGLIYLKMLFFCNNCNTQFTLDKKLYHLKCGCRYCKNCLNKKIDKATKNLRYINQYEKNTFEKIMCCCSKDFDPIEAIIEYENNNNHRNNNDDICKKEAKQRMINYILTLCMNCKKEIRVIKNENGEKKIENKVKYKIIHILPEKGNYKGILYYDGDHIMCLDCFNLSKYLLNNSEEKEKKNENEEQDEETMNEIDTQRLDTQENIISKSKKDEKNKNKKDNKNKRNAIMCNICDKKHILNKNDMEEKCSCNIF